MIDTNDWIQYFPHAEPREQQVHAINKILNEFISGKKYFALEAGTGVGKSAIAITVARYMSNHDTAHDEDHYVKGAFFATTQKLLQDQYENDFSNLGMKSIKSSKNYTCKYKKFQTCAEGTAEVKMQQKGSKYWNVCALNCRYRQAKDAFVNSELSITNFPYLLTEANFNGKVKPRQLLIIDEAHNVETELSKFIEVAVSEQFAKNVLKLEMPDLRTHHQAHEWIRDVYYPKLSSHVKHVGKTLEKFTKLKERLEEFMSLTKQIRIVESHFQRLEYFLEVYDKENWVFELQHSDIRNARKFSFKPIDVSQFSHQYLFRMGYRVLFMSATLIDSDKFFEMVGIDHALAGQLHLTSPFPIKNRPIMFVPIGRMTSKEIDKTLPILVKAIKQVLAAHKNDKGIIHTHSYKIANYLRKNIRSKRLIVPNSENRHELLKKHLASEKPTVLISPSMTEGVDLQGDASRFQILCKVPYPFLGDKLVKKRMNKWRWWYPYQTTKTIVQSVGRSVRSEDDTAVTYVLDADWERFYARNSRLFPADFRACLR
jgi:ATP-dependent DNA helicase DinG